MKMTGKIRSTALAVTLMAAAVPALPSTADAAWGWRDGGWRGGWGLGRSGPLPSRRRVSRRCNRRAVLWRLWRLLRLRSRLLRLLCTSLLCALPGLRRLLGWWLGRRLGPSGFLASPPPLAPLVVRSRDRTFA